MEEFRYTYDLKPTSLVIDAGGFRGDFSAEIFRRYRCEVICFEPVLAFYVDICKRLGNDVVVINRGLGGHKRDEIFRIRNDSTGAFAGEGEPTIVEITDIVSFLESNGITTVDLLKLNVEGMEFEILERLIASDWIKSIVNLQVQFHQCAPDAAKRFESVQAELPKTHDLVFNDGWVWQNWRRK